MVPTINCEFFHCRLARCWAKEALVKSTLELGKSTGHCADLSKVVSLAWYGVFLLLSLLSFLCIKLKIIASLPGYGEGVKFFFYKKDILKCHCLGINFFKATNRAIQGIFLDDTYL